MSDDLESVLAGLLGNRATTPRLVVAPERHIDALADQIDELVAERGAAACVRLVRGKRCATKELTLHEFAAALRFPVLREQLGRAR